MEKIYTAEEIVHHDHKEALWIAIHGGVYDLTKFYKEHPGGEEVLLQLAGKDGSKCFDSIGHSVEAITLRDTFKIGEVEKNAVLEAPTLTAKLESKKSTEAQDEDWQPEKRNEEEEEKSFLPLIAVAVVIYAFVIYYIWF